MINIKDKLNRTNILLHRDKIINADNISTEQFNDDIEQINGQINDLNDVVADSLKQDIFEHETNLINSDLRLIEEKIVNKPAIITKIDANGYHFSHSTFVTFPAGFDFSKCISTKGLFFNCDTLTGFTEPIYLDKCLDASDMFMFCDSLTDVPLKNTSELINCSRMFFETGHLISLPLLDFGKVTNISAFFGYSEPKNLTDLGGFKGLKIDWNDGFGLNQRPNLTYQSIMNVINNLYDFRANADNETTRTIKIHSNTYALLTEDDKLLATNKGWIITY